MSAAVQQPCTCPPESDKTSAFMCLQHGRGRMSNLPFPSRPYHALPVVPEKPAAVLPDDNAARNEYPMFDGLLAYFPGALAEVARVSVVGNRQHNPGEPLHWAREKSTDHANKILRHLADHGLIDGDGIRHSARLAWRALALLQAELEAAGWAPGRASRWPAAPAEPAAHGQMFAINVLPGETVADALFRQYPAERPM